MLFKFIDKGIKYTMETTAERMNFQIKIGNFA